MRTAIVHYWIVADRGGEKVVRALCEMFPGAVIFTHVANAELTRRLFPGHEIRTSFIARLPFAERFYQSYLPLMPLALEQLDLSEFDLVISSESGPAKGIIPAPRTPHICYCHSPMRYIWDQYHIYRRNAGFAARLAMPFIAHRLRQWDVTSAARVDDFVANSKFVAARIGKYYRREATVVYPPVDIEAFSSLERGADPRFEDAYLWVGQLTAYKNPEAAVRALTTLKKRMIIIGDGEGERHLRAIAGDAITFLGRADAATLKQAYASCRALIFPGEEDFGIVPVEAMAAGLPVIALGRGGAAETVRHEVTGILYKDASVDGLISAVEEFERRERDFNTEIIRSNARRFDKSRFKKAMAAIFRRHGVETSPD